MKYLKFCPFYLLSLLPFRFIYFISDIAFVVIYYLIKYRRKVVNANLENAFPDKTKVEIRRIERNFYKHFCDVFLETVKCLTISKKMVNKRFRIKNLSMIDEAHQQKKSIIVYTAHHGNWEWLSFLPLFLPHQVTAFYQELSNSYFDDLMKVIRSRFGVLCVKSNQGYKTLVKFEKEKILTLNCLIGDQSPGKTASKHWVNFLNQESAFLAGTDRIAKKLKYMMIFASMQKKERGKYELEFLLLESNPEQVDSSKIIKSYANKLEDSIKKSPELWLWSHKRWKLTKPDKK